MMTVHEMELDALDFSSIGEIIDAAMAVSGLNEEFISARIEHLPLATHQVQEPLGGWKTLLVIELTNDHVLEVEV